MRKVFKLMCSLIGFAFAVVLIAKLFPVSAAESSFEITDGMYDSYTSTDEYIDSYKFGSYAKKESDVITATQDDAIVNIIPKELFSIEGNYAYYGSEYGFVIKTVYLEEEKAYYSDVLVIDFDTEIIVNSDNTVFYQYIVNDLFEYDFFYSNNNDYFKYGDFEIASSSGFVVPALGSNLSKNKARNIYYKSVENIYYMENLESLNNSDKDYSAIDDNGGYILASYADYLFTIVKNGYCYKNTGAIADAVSNVAQDVCLELTHAAVSMEFPVIGILWDIAEYAIEYGTPIIKAFNEYETYIPGYERKEQYNVNISAFGDKEQQVSRYKELLKAASKKITAAELNKTEAEYYKDENVTFTYYLGGLTKNAFDPTEFKSFCEFDLNIELDSFGYSINRINSVDYYSNHPFVTSEYNYEKVSVNKDTIIEIPEGKSNFVTVNVPVTGYYELVSSSGLDLKFKINDELTDSYYFKANTEYKVEFIAKKTDDSGRASVRLAPKSSNTIEHITGTRYRIGSDNGIYYLTINEYNYAFNIPSEYKIYDANYEVVRADLKYDNDNYYYVLKPNKTYYIYMPYTYDSLFFREIGNDLEFEDGESFLSAKLGKGVYTINVDKNTFFKVDAGNVGNDFKNISVVGSEQIYKDSKNMYYYGAIVGDGNLYIVVKNTTIVRVFKTMFYYSSASEIKEFDGHEYLVLEKGEQYNFKIESKMKNFSIKASATSYHDYFKIEFDGKNVTVMPKDTISIGYYDIIIFCEYEINDIPVVDVVSLRIYVGNNGKVNFTQSLYMNNDAIYAKISLNGELGFNPSVKLFEKIEYKFNVEYFDVKNNRYAIKYYNSSNNTPFSLTINNNSRYSEIKILDLNELYNLYNLAENNCFCSTSNINELINTRIKLVLVSDKIIISDTTYESLNKNDYKQYFNCVFESFDDSNTAYISNPRHLLNALVWSDTIDNKVNVNLNNSIYFDKYVYPRYNDSISRTYYGTFKGNNYTISRLALDKDALFDNLYGKIENLNISNFLADNNCGGAFVAYNLQKGGTIDNVDFNLGSNKIILNCSSSKFGTIVSHNNGIICNCDVTAYWEINNSSRYAGGIVGYTTNNVINCSFNGNIDFNQKSYSFVGGIVGFATTYVNINEKSNVSIINCRANIVLKSKDDAYEGGIVGATSSAQDGGMMSSSPNSTYPLISECEMDGSISGGEFAGGIVGYMQSGKAIMNRSDLEAKSISTGSLGSSIGGIAGCGHVLENNVVKSFNASNSAVGTNVGTIAGEVVQSTAYVYNNSCYESKISVTGDKTNNIGGIVGYILNVSSVNYNRINNLNIEGKAYLGGAVGFMYTGIVNNNEINGTISGRKMSTTTYKGNAHLIMGGLVGYAEKGEIRYNNGNVTINYLSATENSNSLKVCIGSSIGVATGYVSFYNPLLYTSLNYNNLITYTWTTGALWWKETHYYNQAQFVNSYNSVIGLHL